ncbi:MAG: GLUG motif-containing protein [Candidatus Cryptobacteroides sp.]|nr:GLUG motif-containing protein [Candidatus Cryptobacteroides sp.]
MRRFLDMFALASAVALSVISCAKESEDHVNDGTKNKITITASLPDELVTKVKFEAGASVIKPSWEQTDVIRIISETGKSETYSIKEINGKTATFEGNELAGTSFTAIYPGNYETAEALGKRSYTGQVQTGNGSTAHLQLNAMADGLSDISNISFADAGAKLNGAVKLYVKLPENVTSPKGVSLSAASDIFSTDNAGSAKSSSLGLSLENVDISADHIFTAYLMSSWTEAVIDAGTELTLTLKAEGVLITKSFTVEKSVNLAGGHLNTIQLNAENWNTIEGSGTESDPYKLSTTRNLLAMKAALVKGQMTYFKLMNDIDMSSIENWDPLNPDEPYDLGIVFDGGGHFLKNLKSKEKHYSSFFGVLYGKCHNVKFVDAEIVSASNSGAGIIGGYIGTGGKPAIVSGVEASGTVTNAGKGQSVGGLGGNAREATIENCTVNVTVSNPMGDGTNRTATGGVVGKTIDSAVKIKNCIVRGVVEITKGINNTYTGGIVGWQSAAGAEITGCEVYSTVKSAGERVGGIVGHYQGGTLSGCKFYGEVNAASRLAGGIAGITSSASIIENCLSSGKIVCKNIVGGIVGMNENTLTIRCCESSSTIEINVNGVDGVGGVLGLASNGKTVIVEDCIFSGNMNVPTGQRVGGIVGDLGTGSSVRRCYVSGSITGWAGVGGIVGRAGGLVWNANGNRYDNTIESCIAWFDTITATRGDENGGSSGIIVGYTGTKNALKNCWRKPTATLTAKYCSEVYDQEDADATTPLVINAVPSKYTYIYPYHGKAAEASATATSLAQSLGWSADVWNLSGPEPKLK